MFFFFNEWDAAEIYPLSLHAALPIGTTTNGHHFAPPALETVVVPRRPAERGALHAALAQLAEQDPLIGLRQDDRSEEHTSELQSRQYLVCRLLLEKKKN